MSGPQPARAAVWANAARDAGAGALSTPVATVEVVCRRLRGDVPIDPWGCDPEAQDAVDAVLRQVLRVAVTGDANLPVAGPALLVANRRLGIGEPAALGRAVRQVARRRLRFVGLPDIAPVGTVLRRLGAAVNRPAEVAALLRAGHLVGLPLSVVLRDRLRAGTLSPDDVAPALATGAPVIPVAVTGGELSGRWRVHFGVPVPVPRLRGPLALAELADAAQAAVQTLLDEAFPPRWPFS